MSRQRLETFAFWTATIFGPASFVIGGVLNLTHASQTTDALSHLGYPAYFAWILGSGKLLGALAIVVPGLPRLKEWAYAGFFFDLTSAAFSRAMVGDSAADIIAPLGFLTLVLASWWLRPASRRLNAVERTQAGRLERRPIRQWTPVRDTL
jgi:uncharacterized membrane protein YphA (DoxX/SURF4 family)